MRPDITLGEVKAHCAEMDKKYGHECCDHCKYADLGCCDAPMDWALDDTPNDGEKERAGQTYQELLAQKCFLEVENMRYRTITKAMEFALGRKLDL